MVREHARPAPKKHVRNIGTILARVPENAKRPVREVYDGIIPNNHGRTPRVTQKIQQGLLRLVESALDQSSSPELPSLGEALLRASDDPRSAGIDSEGSILREIQHEASALAHAIMAAIKVSKDKSDEGEGL